MMQEIAKDMVTARIRGSIYLHLHTVHCGCSVYVLRARATSVQETLNAPARLCLLQQMHQRAINFRKRISFANHPSAIECPMTPCINGDIRPWRLIFAVRRFDMYTMRLTIPSTTWMMFQLFLHRSAVWPSGNREHGWRLWISTIESVRHYFPPIYATNLVHNHSPTNQIGKSLSFHQVPAMSMNRPETSSCWMRRGLDDKVYQIAGGVPFPNKWDIVRHCTSGWCLLMYGWYHLRRSGCIPVNL